MNVELTTSNARNKMFNALFAVITVISIFLISWGIAEFRGAALWRSPTVRWMHRNRVLVIAAVAVLFSTVAVLDADAANDLFACAVTMIVLTAMIGWQHREFALGVQIDPLWPIQRKTKANAPVEDADNAAAPVEDADTAYVADVTDSADDLDASDDR